MSFSILNSSASFARIVRARSWRCPPPRLASTATPRSISSPLTSSLVSWSFRKKYAVFLFSQFSGKKLEDICPSTHNMEVPNVKRKDFQLIGMDDDFLSLMDDNGDTRDDLKCPEDAVGEEIRNAIDKETDILVS